jgi:hypothetical protein
MSEIHCHRCGGFITDRASVSYRLPTDGAVTAGSHSALCSCNASVVYGPKPGSLAAWAGLGRSRVGEAAALN